MNNHDERECACMEQARERIHHETANLAVDLIEMAVGAFDQNGRVDPNEALSIVSFITAEVLYRAAGQDVEQAIALATQQARNVISAVKTYQEQQRRNVQ